MDLGVKIIIQPKVKGDEKINTLEKNIKDFIEKNPSYSNVIKFERLEDRFIVNIVVPVGLTLSMLVAKSFIKKLKKEVGELYDVKVEKWKV